MDVLFNDTAKVSTESEAQAPQAPLSPAVPSHSRTALEAPQPCQSRLRFFIGPHHSQKPIVGFAGRVDAVVGR